MNRPELAPVMFFDGEEHFADAGALLLEYPTVEAVVVRGVAKAHLYNLIHTPEPSAEDVRQALFTDAPHLAELDAYVQKHHAMSQISPRFSLDTLADTSRAIVKKGASGVHIDSPTLGLTPPGTYEGPLSLSIRIDQGRMDRTFYVRRTNDVLTIDGPQVLPTRNIYNTMSQVSPTFTTSLLAVPQQRGDAIFFANYPAPTIHAVEVADRRATKAVVASYLLRDTVQQ
jgi:hypothetical protein